MHALHVYLNDHLAGSVAGLALLQHLIDASLEPAAKHELSALKQEIEEDQQALEDLLKLVGGAQHSLRQAGAWILEKLARIKLQLSSDKNVAGMHQALEGLSLGIMGKRSLWRSLAATAQTNPALQGCDYATLEARAWHQFRRVETLVLHFAPLAYLPSDPPSA